MREIVIPSSRRMNIIGYIITGITTFVVGFLLERFKAKPKIFYWSQHSFQFNLREESLSVITDSLTIQNLGGVKALDLEIVTDVRPDIFELFPSISYQSEILQNGNFVIKIKILGPKEYLTFQVLSYTKQPKLLNIRSSAGTAIQIPVLLQRLYPKWWNGMLKLLILFGLGALIYLFVKLGCYIFESK